MERLLPLIKVRYMEHTVCISPDGSTATFVFHDEHPLSGLGPLTLIRASNVRFDNIEKQWRVFLRRMDGSEIVIGPGFKKRADAIGYEVGYCHDLLDDFYKEVDQFIQDHQGRMSG